MKSLTALIALCARPPLVQSWVLQGSFARRLSTFRVKAENDGGQEPDLFDYFDPLLSPHAYPDGIAPENTPLSEDELAKREGAGTAAFGFRLGDNEALPATTTTSEEELASDFPSRGVSPDFFDPTISPHAYANGTPDAVIGDANVAGVSSSSRVGILLIDHGSRNTASNERLHQLAKLYQEQFGSSQTVVRAAHMEIAQPSIPEALQSMLEEEAELDEIICHPFFLSPDGRHASKDIPEIIEAAQTDLKIEIPISTTKPVGAEVGILLQAVHNTVKQSTPNL